MKLSSFICCIGLSLSASGLAGDGPPDQFQDVPVKIEVVTDASPEEKQIVLLKEDIRLASVKFPPDVGGQNIEDGLKAALWDPAKENVAIAFKGERKSWVFVFVRNQSGKYIGVDVSEVEIGNIGKLGDGGRTPYNEFETVPVKWLERPNSDKYVQIQMRTRVWNYQGQRYTTLEPLLISREGKPMWR